LNICRFLTSFLIIYLAVSPKILLAADTLILKDPNVIYEQYQMKNNFLEVYNDPTGTLKINDIILLTFHPLQSIEKKYKGTYWVKVNIKNESLSEIHWMILQGDPHVGVFEFYVPDKNGEYFLFNRGGSALPFDVRKYMSNSIASELPVSVGEVKTFYFRYQSKIDFAYKLTVQTSNFYTHYSLSEYFSLGLYYGIIIIMAVYNLFIYFSVRDRVYIFYVLYVISISIFNTANDTMGFQFLWPWAPQLNYYTYYFGHLLLVIFIFLYSDSFLNLRKQFPFYYKIILVSILIYVAQFVIEYNFLETSLFYFTFIIPFILIYFAAVKIFRQGYNPAKFFIAGFSAILIGLLSFILMERGIVAPNTYNVYAFNLGLLIEVVIFSRAIGERFRFLKKEKEKADKRIIEQLKENESLKDEINRDLEDKVMARTRELDSAKGELEKAYEEIKRMNKFLKEDNEKLQYDIKQLARARVMLRGVKYEEFFKIYPTDESCHKVLAEMKWRNGFNCVKCKNVKYSEGKTSYARRCTKCNYEESAVLFTIFSRVKFPLTKAFYMLFLYVSSKEKLTSTHMSKILKLRQKTCWSFLQKIKESMEIKKSANKSIDKWTDLILE
jgi:two-component system, sensor histidine kinase LadS